MQLGTVETSEAQTAWDSVNRAILNTPERQEKFKRFRDGSGAYQAPTAVDDAQLRAQIHEHDLDDVVRLVGAVDDVAPLLASADVYVQPSHFEAFGSSAIEALASGVPVVASGVGGLGDFLIDGENALLHQPRSTQSLTAALNRMLDDGPLRERLSKAGRRTATDRFEIHGLLDRFARLIVSTVERR